MALRLQEPGLVGIPLQERGHSSPGTYFVEGGLRKAAQASLNDIGSVTVSSDHPCKELTQTAQAFRDLVRTLKQPRRESRRRLCFRRSLILLNFSNGGKVEQDADGFDRWLFFDDL